MSNRVIAFNVAYKRITQSNSAAILLSQLFWYCNSSTKEFYLTDKRIHDETALTRHEIIGAKKLLSEMKIVNIISKRTKYSVQPVTHYSVNLEVLSALVEPYLQFEQPVDNHDSEVRKADFSTSENRTSVCPETGHDHNHKTHTHKTEIIKSEKSVDNSASPPQVQPSPPGLTARETSDLEAARQGESPAVQRIWDFSRNAFNKPAIKLNARLLAILERGLRLYSEEALKRSIITYKTKLSASGAYVPESMESCLEAILEDLKNPPQKPTYQSATYQEASPRVNAAAYKPHPLLFEPDPKPKTAEEIADAKRKFSLMKQNMGVTEMTSSG